jgi:alpha 1,6-mannosyltransferase
LACPTLLLLSSCHVTILHYQNLTVLAVMLLSARPSAFKLLGCSALVICIVVFFFNNQIGGLRGLTAFSGFIVPTKVTTPITPIPETIWYKLGPKGLNDQTKDWVSTCVDKNPTYKPVFMTDLSGDDFVKEKFASRPDIVQTYLALTIPILKADILRYLLLFSEGGIWNDLDISCGDTPMRDWVPKQYKKDANLIVGLEFDKGWPREYMRQFASWTIMAKPGSRHLSNLIEDIMRGLQGKTKEHNVTIAELTFDMIGDVVDLTGPRLMTTSILSSLSLMLNDTVDGRNISDLAKPKLLGDVLVLPSQAFAASTNRIGGKSGVALVTHHYAGTWKNDHGGELA